MVPTGTTNLYCNPLPDTIPANCEPDNTILSAVTVPVNVGLPANTFAPVPVSSVNAAAKFAELGVAKNVAIPVANPEIPVDTGSPVALVNVADDGVPNAPLNVTNAPADPTLTANADATLVPNPEIPVDTGSPVAFVSVTLVGVPNIGVTNVGLVLITTLPVPVIALLTNPSTALVNTAWLAVKLDAVTVPVTSSAPVTASLPPINAFVPVCNTELLRILVALTVVGAIV